MFDFGHLGLSWLGFIRGVHNYDQHTAYMYLDISSGIKATLVWE